MNTSIPRVVGQFTPTKFARADIYDSQNNPEPISRPLELIPGLVGGGSTITPANLMPVPNHDNDDIDLETFNEFIAKMEAQWEGRDTYNADSADAVIGFLKYNPSKDPTETAHDGTKGTLNIFAYGRYAHPLKDCNEFDIRHGHRSRGVELLDTDNYVGFKKFRQKDVNSLPDFATLWEETTNGRFEHLRSSTKGINPDWKEKMSELAVRQKEIGKKSIPILALYGVDVANNQQLQTLKNILVAFLEEEKPQSLMISGKRSKGVADRAEDILRYALSASSWIPPVLITGGADGVDSVALRLLQ